jgi:hypothetical protein
MVWADYLGWVAFALGAAKDGVRTAVADAQVTARMHAFLVDVRRHRDRIEAVGVDVRTDGLSSSSLTAAEQSCRAAA